MDSLRECELSGVSAGVRARRAAVRPRAADNSYRAVPGIEKNAIKTAQVGKAVLCRF